MTEEQNYGALGMQVSLALGHFYEIKIILIFFLFRNNYNPNYVYSFYVFSCLEFFSVDLFHSIFILLIKNVSWLMTLMNDDRFFRLGQLNFTPIELFSEVFRRISLKSSRQKKRNNLQNNLLPNEWHLLINSTAA